MKIVFLKDHLDYKAGEVVDNHPNAAYLIILKVAKESKEKKPTKKKKA